MVARLTSASALAWASLCRSFPPPRGETVRVVLGVFEGALSVFDGVGVGVTVGVAEAAFGVIEMELVGVPVLEGDLEGMKDVEGV